MLSRYIKLLFLFICISLSTVSNSKTIEQYVDQRCKVNCVDVDTLLNATRLVADSLGIDYLILISLIRVESGFNKKAKNGSSVGLMQVHLRYHKKKFDTSDVFSPYANIFVGASILKDCMVRYKNNVNNSLRCYNGGGDKNYVYKVNKVLSEVRQLSFN
jgi:soluble lytic murein transglycosylase-like protein